MAETTHQGAEQKPTDDEAIFNVKDMGEYLTQQVAAQAEAHTQAPWGSTEAAQAVIGYARLGRRLLLDPSANFGPDAQRRAEEAQELLCDSAVQMAEEAWASRTQDDPAKLAVLVSLMKELRHSHQDVIIQILEVLDREPPAELPYDSRLIERVDSLGVALEGLRNLLGDEPKSR